MNFQEEWRAWIKRETLNPSTQWFTQKEMLKAWHRFLKAKAKDDGKIVVEDERPAE